ncbi:hypothetical protein BJY52DRAFT_1299559 [Lactarius psammicola]|nr:hypothetical protein BJY52DRAFT_1299559 [Lactarius psammicola]
MAQYVRESERVVRQVFAHARASSPWINFFDELDARRAARTCSTRRCAAPGGSTGCSTSTCPWRMSVPESCARSLSTAASRLRRLHHLSCRRTVSRRWSAASAARGTTAPIWLRSCGGRAWIGVPLAPRVTPRAWWCWLRTSRLRWIRSCLS